MPFFMRLLSQVCFMLINKALIVARCHGMELYRIGRSLVLINFEKFQYPVLKKAARTEYFRNMDFPHPSQPFIMNGPADMCGNIVNDHNLVLVE